MTRVLVVAQAETLRTGDELAFERDQDGAPFEIIPARINGEDQHPSDPLWGEIVKITRLDDAGCRTNFAEPEVWIFCEFKNSADGSIMTTVPFDQLVLIGRPPP